MKKEIMVEKDVCDFCQEKETFGYGEKCSLCKREFCETCMKEKSTVFYFKAHDYSSQDLERFCSDCILKLDSGLLDIFKEFEKYKIEQKELLKRGDKLNGDMQRYLAEKRELGICYGHQ